MIVQYAWRLVVRNRRRTGTYLFGLALAVGLLSGILFFVDATGRAMTATALAPVRLDIVAHAVEPTFDPAIAVASIAAQRGVLGVEPVTAADFTSAVRAGGTQPSPVGRMFALESSYFDTADGMLRNKKAALRLRRENERTVCCMKLRGEEESTDGLRAHEEYQCDAGTLEDGLRQLPEKGAPEALCGELLHAELKEICTVSFRRCAVLLQEQDTVCELALDKGELRREGRGAPLCEIELEYVAGDEKAFHALAAELADQLDLVPENESKLARAMKV